MKVLYFAWLRERVGTGEEEVSPPPEITSVSALMDWLAKRSAGHARAFENRDIVRAAVNQEFADPADAVSPGDEVAFFPPMTGGRP
ncbi:MAG: molybdopterin converting factor subunit 1 [Alphaproteobacteria bacterium]|nr:molybdopterin converting factor subunit 1 [Alphaproteobacteria bacterium]